ncbi:MAG: integrin alpha [Actinomycetota bacterium]|nr:integrin alpha [Actinomycetota bacterium]
MNHRSILARVLSTVGGAAVVAACTASTALAQTGLPRTYQPQRVDSPVSVANGVFGRGMAGAGDLNGDGIDDLLMAQQADSPRNDGMVFVISGATGSLIARIDAPDPGGAGNRAGFGSFWTSKVGSRAIPTSDLASCAGGAVGAQCPQNPMGPPDNVPEIVVGARGVDANGTDTGRVYIYDGATRALLKRIDMPPADAATPNALLRGSGFGRTALNPAGLTACAGNFGVGECPSVPRAVAIGDLDRGGRPDLVVGAPQLTESPATAQPGSNCAGSPAGTVCEQAGRAYFYRGEDIAGSDPAVILDGTRPGQAVTTIRNPDAQADKTSGVPADNEQLANTVTAVGDLGACRAVGIRPGETCSRVDSVTTPDGVPDVVIPSPGSDLPLDNPDPAFANAGVAYLIDGATGAVLYTYLHPERQSGATFGSQLGSHEPAVGDLGNTAAPDVYLPAPLQNTPTVTGAGRGYVVNGNFKTGSGTVLLSRLDDPTPSRNGNFGGGSAGVGDLVRGMATPANEMLIGVEGFTNSERNDVHVFNPATEQVLQTVPDPDRQAGSAFGGSIVPLGDINGDGFLDFAASAETFDGSSGSADGRVYIFRSDDSAPPTGPTGPTGAGPGMPGAPAGPAGPAPPGSPAPNPGAPTPPRASGEKLTAKLQVARSRVLRQARRLDVLALITRRASGQARVEFAAAGRRFRFSEKISNGRLRFSRTIPAAQAALGTGIMTISYPGDADTRPQSVRLRAASRPANLALERPRLQNGRLRASGTVAQLARGVVRVQIEWVNNGETTTLERTAPIRDGRWALDAKLSDVVARAIAGREGTVHSYTLFTGDLPRRARGEMRSLEVLPAR